MYSISVVIHRVCSNIGNRNPNESGVCFVPRSRSYPVSSSMNIDDFIAGIMSSLKLTQQVEIPATNLEEKIVNTFNALEQLAQRKGIELRFHCSLNPCTRRSVTVQYALVRAEQAGLIQRDGQTIEIELNTEESADIINASPLSLSEWKLLSKNLKTEAFSSLNFQR